MTLVLFVTMMSVLLASRWLWTRYMSRRSQLPAFSGQQAQSMRQPFVPYGVFLANTHTWAAFSADGTLRIGLDSVVTEALGRVQNIQLPPVGAQLARNDVLLTLQVGDRFLRITAPLAGEVVAINSALVHAPDLLLADPYGLGWAVRVRPRDHKAAIEPLYLGNGALAYLRKEHQRLVELIALAEAAEASAKQPNTAPSATLLERGAVAQLPTRAFATFQTEFLSDRARS